MKSKLIAYYRVSTARQGQSGLGLEAQREAVARYVATIGGSLSEEYVEVESGKANDRPVIAQAMAACRKAGGILVIAKLDRLARSVHFISGLMEAKVQFVAVDMPFANPLMLHLMAAFAEHERQMISERTKAALAAAKARGVRLGTYGPTLAANNRASAAKFAESVAPVVNAVIASGATTLQAIADGLNARGIASRENASWSPTAVSRVLARIREASSRVSQSAVAA